jgi:hypothetical protein
MKMVFRASAFYIESKMGCMPVTGFCLNIKRRLSMILRLVVLSVIFSKILVAQGIPSEVDKRISTFYTQVKSGEFEQALKNISDGGPLFTKIFGDEATGKSFVIQLETLGKYYGDLFDYDLVKQNSLGRVHKFTYFFYYEDYPARFIFSYYESQSEWILINFSFDDSIFEEF